MSEANKRQIGGQHYKTGGIEHWDCFGPEYLMGVATKYVARWRRKDGRQDLEKALHYCDKLNEMLSDNRVVTNTYANSISRAKVALWMKQIELNFVERMVIDRILFWSSREDMDHAREGIRLLIDADTPVPVPDLTKEIKHYNGPGTPEDGGHHEALWPWFLTTQYVDDQISSDRWMLMLPYYHRVGVEKNWVLEPVAETRNLPRELASCYALHCDTWIIRIEHVPLPLRDFYPYLRRELNYREHEALPEWQKKLYVEGGMTADHKRLLKNEAWAAE